MSDLNEPKKETVRITLPPGAPAKSADQGGGKRETVRITLPERPPASSSAEAPQLAKPPTPTAPSRPVPPPPMARPPVPTPSASKPVRPPILAPRPPVPGAAPAARPPITPPPLAPKAGGAVMPPRPKILPPPPRVIPPAGASPGTGGVAAAPSSYPGSGTQSGPKKETARISILPEPAAAPTPSAKMSKTQPLLNVPPAKIHPAAVNVAAVPASHRTASALAMLDEVPMPFCWILFGISSATLLIQIWNYLAT